MAEIETHSELFLVLRFKLKEDGVNCMEMVFWIGNCWRLPYGQCQGALDLAQFVED